MKTIEWEQVGMIREDKRIFSIRRSQEGSIEQIEIIREEVKIISVYRNQEGDIRVQEEGGKLRSPSEEEKEQISNLLTDLPSPPTKKIPLTDP